jgi:hypothetical protein
METEIQRRIRLCEQADDAEWEEKIALASTLEAKQRAFLKDHPPGLVKALWRHFDATRDSCGCTTPAHERPGCSVLLIEKLLLDAEVL